DARRFAGRHAEHESRAMAAKRQQRDRTRIGEALVRGAGERLVERQRRDERGLAVIVALDADAERAPHERLGAVGADQQFGFDVALAVRRAKPNRDMVFARFDRDDFGRRGPREIATAVEAAQQRVAELARRNRRAERGDAHVAGVEPDAAEIATAADVDALDRLHRRGRIEHAERTERVDARAGEREVALVVARHQVGARRDGFGERDATAGTVERDGEARADQPAAGDQDVVSIDHATMITARGDTLTVPPLPAPNEPDPWT